MPDPIPSFILIGVTEVGTTSLHRCLARHPQIFVPRQQKLYHFAGAWLSSRASSDARPSG